MKGSINCNVNRNFPMFKSDRGGTDLSLFLVQVSKLLFGVILET